MWLRRVHGGRYTRAWGALLCHHFEDLDELRWPSADSPHLVLRHPNPHLGIDNVRPNPRSEP